jgi:antitoxin HicB
MTDLEREAEVERRLRLPYHRVIFGDPVDGSMGEVPELPGCYMSGDTPAEALSNLEQAMATWIESSLSSGDPIPDPAKSLTPVV